MAWDLLLRHKISRSWARGSNPSALVPIRPRRALLAIAATTAAILLPRAIRDLENRRLQRLYAQDEWGFNLDKTVEVPAISSRDLIYGERIQT